MVYNKSCFKKEVHSDTDLPQETRKISNNLTYHLKLLEKEQTKPKGSRRKEIIKIREETNTIDIKIENSNKIKSCFFEKINKVDNL